MPDQRPQPLDVVPVLSVLRLLQYAVADRPEKLEEYSLSDLMERVAAAAARDPERVEPVLRALLGEIPAVPGSLRPVSNAVNEARRAAAVEEFRNGALTTRQAVERLSTVTTPQGVHRLRADRRLLGRTIGNATYWPSWQFDGSGRREKLGDILTALRRFVGDDAVAADRVMRLPRVELRARSVAEALDGEDADRAWAILDSLGGGF